MKTKNDLALQSVQSFIVEIRGVQVILDADIASLYGVETKRINEAVKNNPDKFPDDYMFELTKKELQVLRSKFSTSKVSIKDRYFLTAHNFLLTQCIILPKLKVQSSMHLLNNSGRRELYVERLRHW
ncbi:MAG: ORF6N domain-containing protein [Bacteroidales bacterium]|nr:ORF6N domain-containing protein [Bacteroidales bacterium]